MLIKCWEKPITQNPIALDIGFGDAQSFSEDVAANETVTFIGIEPYKKGFARAVEFFEKQNLQTYISLMVTLVSS